MSKRTKLFVLAAVILLQLALAKAAEKASDIKIGDDDEANAKDPTFLITGGYRPERAKSLAHFLVSIRTKQYSLYYGDNFICAGVIISKMVILTSAACVFQPHRRELYPSGIISVIAGSKYRLTEDANIQNVAVEEIRAHPNYVFGKPGYDLAVVRLLRPLIPDEHSVRVVEIIDETPEDGFNCTIAGWGQVMNLGPMADELLYINVQVLDHNECWFAHPEVKANMICAGEFGEYERTICQGDYGSPLMCDNKLAGVGSFGFGCGTATGVGVYTDITAYHEWIEANSAIRLMVSGLLLICLILLHIYL